MKILFDQNMPWGMHKPLSPHMVHAALSMGWAELRNGDLLSSAEAAGFDLFVTGDQNIRYQQNLSKRRISIVELSSTQWPFTPESLAAFAKAVEQARPGSYSVVECTPLNPRRKRQGSRTEA